MCVFSSRLIAPNEPAPHVITGPERRLQQKLVSVGDIVGSTVHARRDLGKPVDVRSAARRSEFAWKRWSFCSRSVDHVTRPIIAADEVRSTPSHLNRGEDLPAPTPEC